MNKATAKKALLERAKREFEPLKFKEFKCPVCGGIATVSCIDGSFVTECHACGLRAGRYEDD
ncbi:MAG: hypothetical protein Q4C46_05675 [Bacillota bacterium]|nr:hypothetical protein [Bacillota bacterium]